MSATIIDTRTGEARTGGAPGASRSLCTFRLAGLHLGVDVTQVQEVIRRPETTRVPLVSPVIGGLINLRGEIVTTIDLRRRMGLEARADGDAAAMLVVIRTAEGPVSLVVDEIDDVVDVDESTFEPPPPTLTGIRRGLVSGVFKLDGTLLLVLDLARAVDPGDIQAQQFPDHTVHPGFTGMEDHESDHHQNSEAQS